MAQIRIVALMVISILGVISCSKSKYYSYHCIDNNAAIKCEKRLYLKVKHGYFSFVTSTNKYDTTVYYTVRNPNESDYRKTIIDSTFKIIKRKDVGQYFKYTVNNDSLFITGYEAFDKKINGFAGLFSVRGNKIDAAWHATVNNASVPFRYDHIFEGRFIGDTTLIIDGESRICYHIEEKSDLLKRKYRLFIDKKKMLPVCLIEEDNILKVLSFKTIKQ